MSKFTDDVIIAAMASQRVWAVPASVSLAQFALESGYGTHMPPGSNNAFGIKALKGQPSVTVNTREVINGKSVIIKAAFRKFDSMADGFDAHARLLATKGVYAPAMEKWKAGDLEGGIRLMGAKYATDPSYAAKLLSLIGAQSLAQYDKPMPFPDSPKPAEPPPAVPGTPESPKAQTGLAGLLAALLNAILSLIPKRKP